MNNHDPLAYAIYSHAYDPLLVIRKTRAAMLTPQPDNKDGGWKYYVWYRRREAYRSAVSRLGAQVDLPSDNPFSPSPETARVMNALVRREAALKGGLCLERL